MNTITQATVTSIFKTWKTSREMFLPYFENYTLDQLNQIPDGFSNNLIWNIGHIIVAQQSLIYTGSNLDRHISDDMVNLYKPGTKPTQSTSQNQVDELKHLLTSVIEKTESDYKNQIFNTYNERTTGTGFHLGSLEDAFHFNNYHEGLHLGFMTNIRKFV